MISLTRRSFGRSAPAIMALAISGLIALPVAAMAALPSEEQPSIPGYTTYPPPASPFVSTNPAPLSTETSPAEPRGSRAAERSFERDRAQGIVSTPSMTQ